jgi:hypothetical protein
MVHSPLHDRVLVGGRTAVPDSVYVVSCSNNSIVHTLPISSVPWRMAWSPASDLVYISMQTNRSVAVVAGDGARMVGALSVNRAPFVLLPVARHRRVYLGHLNSPMVYVIRDSLTGGVTEFPAASRTMGRSLVAAPNPFAKTIEFACGHTTRPASVAIYSCAGRLVKTLRSEGEAGGRCVWDGRDAAGREIPAGAYIALEEGRDALGLTVVKLR